MDPSKANPEDSFESLKTLFGESKKEEELNTEDVEAWLDPENEVVIVQTGGSEYRAPLQKGPTVILQEDPGNETYWITDGEESYWADKNGELNPGNSSQIEQVHQIAQEKVEGLETDYLEEIDVEKEELMKGDPGNVIPESEHQDIADDINQYGEINVSEYTAEGLPDSTGNRVAELIGRNLRRNGYEVERQEGMVKVTGLKQNDLLIKPQ